MAKSGIVLGHIISDRGIEIDKTKVEQICQNLGAFFHFAMTKPVKVILVGRKLLQKFCNVIFIGPHCFGCSCLLSIL